MTTVLYQTTGVKVKKAKPNVNHWMTKYAKAKNVISHLESELVEAHRVISASQGVIRDLADHRNDLKAELLERVKYTEDIEKQHYEDLQLEGRCL